MTEYGLSIGVSPRESVDRFVSIAQQAEAAGFGAIWVIDSQFAMKDATVAITVGLRETDRIAIGSGVTNLQTRDLSVTANTFATLAVMSGGRALLGLGAGDSAVFPLGLRPSTLAQLTTGISDLRALTTGQGTAGGDLELKLAFVPEEPVPIYLAASQPRMLELAGAVADGVIVMGAANAELIAAQIAHVRRGVLGSGRPPDSVTVDVWVPVGVDGPEGAGVERMRSWASAKARWMAGYADLPGTLEAFLPEMQGAAAAYDFSDHLSVHADHASTVSDELTAALAVVGTPDQCAARLAEIVALGIDRLTVTLMPGGRERHLEVLANDVLPGMT